MDDKPFGKSNIKPTTKPNDKPTGKPTAVPIHISPTHGNMPKQQPQQGMKFFSEPPSRPRPPKAPTNRPRVPTCEPPEMALPPSTVMDAPLALAPATNVTIQPAPHRKNSTGRSLTNNIISSSSAPNISYMTKEFIPSMGIVTEKPAAPIASPAKPESSSLFGKVSADDKSSKPVIIATAPSDKEKDRKEIIEREEKIDISAEELMAKSPTIFSMLKLDSDVRRKSSIAAVGPGPGLLPTTTNIVDESHEDDFNSGDGDDLQFNFDDGAQPDQEQSDDFFN